MARVLKESSLSKSAWVWQVYINGEHCKFPRKITAYMKMINRSYKLVYPHVLFGVCEYITEHNLELSIVSRSTLSKRQIINGKGSRKQYTGYGATTHIAVAEFYSLSRV